MSIKHSMRTNRDREEVQTNEQDTAELIRKVRVI